LETLNLPESVDAKPNSNAGAKERTPYQKFQTLASGLIKVPKAELDKKMKQAKAMKRPPTK
jgi:hypothetical protein